MPHPEEVKRSQTFSLDKVIYNHDEFSIGVGIYSLSNEVALCMRWNGTEIGGAGFPYAGKHPLWFTLPSKLTHSFLTTLLQNEELTNQEKENISSYLELFGK